MNLNDKLDARKLGISSTSKKSTSNSNSNSNNSAKPPPPKVTSTPSLLPGLCDYSSSSDDEDENENENKNKNEDNNNNNNNNNSVKSNNETEKKKEDDDEEERELLAARAKLKNLKPASATTTTSEKPRSGLLSMLPPPKSNQFIKKKSNNNNNNNNNNKSKNSTTDNKGQTPSFLMPRTVKSKKKDEDENGSVLPKFDFNPAPIVPDYKFTDDPDLESESSGNQQQEEENESYLSNRHQEEKGSSLASTSEVQPGPSTPASNSSDSLMNQEAWQKLCGNKRKAPGADIEFTEVSASNLVGDNHAEMMKQITSEYRPPSNKEYFGATGSKKKHQITYLAHVAKERDTELRQMWSQSKFNKNQARQKYGF